MEKIVTDLTRNLQTVGRICRAVNNEQRQRMLSFLAKHPGSSVGTVQRAMSLEQSVASLHLGILRKENIVTTTREGQYVLYALNVPRLEAVSRLAAAMDEPKTVTS